MTFIVRSTSLEEMYAAQANKIYDACHVPTGRDQDAEVDDRGNLIPINAVPELDNLIKEIAKNKKAIDFTSSSLQKVHEVCRFCYKKSSGPELEDFPRVVFFVNNFDEIKSKLSSSVKDTTNTATAASTATTATNVPTMQQDQKTDASKGSSTK